MEGAGGLKELERCRIQEPLLPSRSKPRMNSNASQAPTPFLFEFGKGSLLPEAVVQALTPDVWLR